jgi:hypothetical protein
VKLGSDHRFPSLESLNEQAIPGGIMTAIRLVGVFGGAFFLAGCGCGDLAARRQATITQIDAIGDPSPGQPFEVDASRLPADWGAVQTEQSKDSCGSPVTRIIVPQGHGIRLILAPTTRPIGVGRAGLIEPTDVPDVPAASKRTEPS